MEYFLIDHEFTTSIVGTNYTQIGFSNSYPKFSPNSIYELNEDNINFFELITDGIVLAKGSIPTDFMDMAFCTHGIVVSERVKDLLTNFNLPNHRFFPLSISYHNSPYPCYILYIAMDILKYVNWPESQFYTVNGLSNKKDISLLNRTEYENLIIDVREYHFKSKELYDSIGLPKPGTLKAITQLKKDSISSYGYKRLVLNESITQFSLINELGYFYVSKPLKDELEKMNISGIKMEPTRRIRIK